LTKSLLPKVSRQRLRIKYTRGQEIKYISHLDLMRLWERALRRASIPVAYSEGFNPRPRLSFGLPLAVGITSDAELLDIFLEQRISPYHLTVNISKQLPSGVSVAGVQEIGLKVASLQSQATLAEYTVVVNTDKPREQIQSTVQDFLKRKHVNWQHKRDGKIKEYDIREVVEDIQVSGQHDNDYTLSMRLKISGRPEQVTTALGFTSHPKSIHRTNIIFN